MFRNRRQRQHLQGFFIGLAITTICTLLFFRGDADPQAELYAFDWRVRNCNSLGADAPIVHVDVDDNSLARLGRWPWPRKQIADLIRTISELEPSLIMVDFLFSEASSPRIEDPRLETDDSGEQVEVIGELTDANVVYDDLELADALRSAGNLVLAVQLETFAPGEPDLLEDRLGRWWSQKKGGSLQEAITDLGLRDTPQNRARIERELLRLRMKALLLANFTLSDQELAERLGCGLREVEAVVAGVKSTSAGELVARLSTANGLPDRDDVLAAILKDRKERRNADRKDVVDAYRNQQGLLAMRKALHPLDDELAAHIYRAPRATPPLPVLAEAATDLSAVNFSPDRDGAVRRVPILIDHRGKSIAHMGLAAACRVLGLDLGSMTISSDLVLTIPIDPARADSAWSEGRAGACHLPLDDHGNLIIHWTRTAGDWLSGRDFRHISAAKLMAIVDAREKIARNQIAINYKLAEVVAAAKGGLTIETPAEGGESATKVVADTAYRRNVNRVIALERTIRRARLRQNLPPKEIEALKEERERLAGEIELEQRNAASAIEMNCAEIDQMPAEEIAADPDLKRDAEIFRCAKKLLDDDVAWLRQVNHGLEETVQSLKQELIGHIKDKYVFLGFAATAQGDIVPTPIHSRTNGVMSHAQVFNAILRNRLIATTDRWVGVLICLLGGTLTGLVTSTRAPRFALLFALGLMLIYALFNCYVLFMRLDLWVALVAPIFTMFVTWAFVTLYRQLTAEREKRLFAKQLAQYTSPALAARIAESPEAAQAFKTVQTREVTCFFSDLRGFTTLTEVGDPELVQHVLNTYLQRMSHVIWAKRGLINKFMGDGIMAFFNASVDPMEDHATAACETALDALDELERLKIECKGDPAAALFDALHMRVGMATGFCMNGDLGSELKTDYTIIGDVVNLGARLEPANKVFGTRIMVSGPTREAVKDHYEFRYLAELQVKGKGHTVPVYEVVCRKGQLADDQRAYVERFEAGVELYKSRKWDECIVHFTRLLARRFDDPGPSRYIDACQELKTFPPDDLWKGALELKEK